MRNRIGTVSMIALTLFLFCGQTAPQQCAEPPAPSHAGAEAAGIAIIAGVTIGTIVLVHVHHAHHMIKGCVTIEPDKALTVVNEGDQKTYILEGVTPNIKPGDRFQLHGNKLKKDKTDPADDQTFMVEKVSKHYGPCTTAPTAP
jgi:hypothetical protein